MFPVLSCAASRPRHVAPATNADRESFPTGAPPPARSPSLHPQPPGLMAWNFPLTAIHFPRNHKPAGRLA
jgi:hypothetical protein